MSDFFKEKKYTHQVQRTNRMLGKTTDQKWQGMESKQLKESVDEARDVAISIADDFSRIRGVEDAQYNDLWKEGEGFYWLVS
jgi:hypothetical protein